ncbi:hypothetical protein BURMUCGD1_5379 [Burkholderia multivorans CGD1]|nr:hypothetical protein BURMUCGD1_5379 [Burkholderia multivorans CGD1]
MKHRGVCAAAYARRTAPVARARGRAETSRAFRVDVTLHA